MKKLMFSLTLLMISYTATLAQPGQGRHMMQERVEAQRVAFITQRLQLTPDESAKFWPLYNEYREKQQDLRRSSMPEEGLRNLSDAEAEVVIEQHLDMEEQMLRLKREYYGRLKSAIPPGKIARLFPAEMEFNRMVLERVRERMGQRN